VKEHRVTKYRLYPRDRKTGTGSGITKEVTQQPKSMGKQKGGYTEKSRKQTAAPNSPSKVKSELKPQSQGEPACPGDKTGSSSHRKYPQFL
jgi:hypothetical protein